MADRRMFNKKLTECDDFLDMPKSSQCLYFHFCMEADDEGFVNNPKKIMRSVGVSEDDFKILLAKNYILHFESGIIVIRHWKIHNLIRSDRFTPTIHQEEKKMLAYDENNTYVYDAEMQEIQGVHTSGIPSDNQAVYPIKYSIDKNIYISSDNEDKARTNKDNVLNEIEEHFSLLRNKYPSVRRGSKAKSLKIYKQYIGSGHKYCDKNIKLTEKQIWYAVMNYIHKQEELETEPIYYKNFETLMNQLADWVVEDGT